MRVAEFSIIRITELTGFLLGNVSLDMYFA
jgi:hypothetical protein